MSEVLGILLCPLLETKLTIEASNSLICLYDPMSTGPKNSNFSLSFLSEINCSDGEWSYIIRILN